VTIVDDLQIAIAAVERIIEDGIIVDVSQSAALDDYGLRLVVNSLGVEDAQVGLNGLHLR
jgi:hypothetical protein